MEENDEIIEENNIDMFDNYEFLFFIADIIINIYF